MEWASISRSGEPSPQSAAACWRDELQSECREARFAEGYSSVWAAMQRSQTLRRLCDSTLRVRGQRIAGLCLVVLHRNNVTAWNERTHETAQSQFLYFCQQSPKNTTFGDISVAVWYCSSMLSLEIPLKNGYIVYIFSRLLEKWCLP